MKAAIRGLTVATVARVRSWLPTAVDLHVYGGAALASAGATWAWRPAGLILFGAFLVYLGLRRP